MSRPSAPALLAPFILGVVTLSPSALARIGYTSSSQLPPVIPTPISTRNDDGARPRDPTRRSTSASDRVNGGHATSPGQYAFFSQMWWNGVGQGCGGSLIASKWILTAAHCVVPFLDNIERTGAPEWRISAFCAQGDNCGAPQQIIRSKRAVLHPWYHAETPRWDFALLELSHASAAAPIHIDHDSSKFSELQSGSTLKGLGMGFINDAGEFSSHLLEVDNHFLPRDRCRLYYTTGDGFDDSVMCTNGANFGMCDGDSGGPVVVSDPGAPYGFTQVAVTSFGAPQCEHHNYPDGSARVGAAMNWIKETVCLSYGPSEANRPHFCPPPVPSPSPTPAPWSNPTVAPSSNPTEAPQPNPTSAPQPDPTVAPQSNPTPQPTESPLVQKIELAESRGDVDADGGCVDNGRFFHLKKRKHRSCKKVKGKKVKKVCDDKKTTAKEACRRACGTCS